MSVNIKTFWSVTIFTSLHFRQCFGGRGGGDNLIPAFTGQIYNLSCYFLYAINIKVRFHRKTLAITYKKYKLINLNMSMIQEIFYM